jgi:hypothetical protein
MFFWFISAATPLMPFQSGDIISQGSQGSHQPLSFPHNSHEGSFLFVSMKSFWSIRVISGSNQALWRNNTYGPAAHGKSNRPMGFLVLSSSAFGDFLCFDFF